MISADQQTALLMEIADLRIRLANVEAEGQRIITETEGERDRFGHRCEELETQLAEKDATIKRLRGMMAPSADGCPPPS